MGCTGRGREAVRGRVTERGSALPLVALAVVVMMISVVVLSAMATRLRVRAQAQAAADAAALAGAATTDAEASSIAEANGATIEFIIRRGNTIRVVVSVEGVMAEAVAERRLISPPG